MGLALRSGTSLADASLDFTLVFGTLPFARIFTAAMGGRDEVYSLQHVFVDGAAPIPLCILDLIIVVVPFAPPLYRGFQVLMSWPSATFLGFWLLPFGIYLLGVLVGMNTLLDLTLLAQDGPIGSPVLVNVWTVFGVGELPATWTAFFSLLKTAVET